MTNLRYIIRNGEKVLQEREYYLKCRFGYEWPAECLHKAEPPFTEHCRWQDVPTVKETSDE